MYLEIDNTFIFDFLNSQGNRHLFLNIKYQRKIVQSCKWFWWIILHLIISYIILQQILNGGNNNQIGSLRLLWILCHYKKIIQRISYLVKIHKISPIATLSEMKSDITETVKKIWQSINWNIKKLVSVTHQEHQLRCLDFCIIVL